MPDAHMTHVPITVRLDDLRLDAFELPITWDGAVVRQLAQLRSASEVEIVVTLDTDQLIELVATGGSAGRFAGRHRRQPGTSTSR